MILLTKGSPYFRVARTMFTFGRTVSISTPYFFATSRTWSLVAFISRPVLKNTYLTGGREGSICLASSIMSIRMSLSAPPRIRTDRLWMFPEPLHDNALYCHELLRRFVIRIQWPVRINPAPMFIFVRFVQTPSSFLSCVWLQNVYSGGIARAILPIFTT